VRDVEAYVIHPASIAVSREHRRAKTDRLDTELLLRAFLGWLRGEKQHCSMVAIPTVEDEDARRPNRERGNLVTEQTRIVNQIKAILARFGIRTFRPTLRKAEEKLGGLRTAETKFFHLHPSPDPFPSCPNRDRAVTICRRAVTANPSSSG
jgi:transposase